MISYAVKMELPLGRQVIVLAQVDFSSGKILFLMISFFFCAIVDIKHMDILQFIIVEI
jgi:hypothetical protein